MKRTFEFFRGCRVQKDWLGLTLLAAAAATALAVVSILFSDGMVDASLKRFHLASESYPQWAAHQCVPSMYNFENKVWFSSHALGQDGELQPNFEIDEPNFYHSTVNHFPARHITFGHRRSQQFKNSDSGWFKMTSTFRGRQLESIWRVRKDGNNVLRVQRLGQNSIVLQEPQ